MKNKPNVIKAIVFDSGPLINLSMNGLLYILEELKKNFNGKFLITKAVKYEVLEHPVKISRFKLGALKIENLIKKKVLEMPSALEISDEKINIRTKKLLNIANHSLQIKGKWLDIVSEGEISCLALSSELKEKGIKNIIAIDERTTRLLCENPKNLEKTISKKLHTKAKLANKDLKIFSQYKIIRSPEIAYTAYKKGLIRLKGKNVLEALLYATKFKGAAISFEEIKEIKNS